MKTSEIYTVMRDAAKENPNLYVGVTKEGRVLLGDSSMDLVKTAMSKGYEIACIGHGKNESVKHFIYKLQ